MDDAGSTFTLLPLHMDPASKAIKSTMPSSNTSSNTLPTALTALNNLHRTILSLPPEAKQTPPPPMPVNPKRSAQIQKMREQGNTALQRASTSKTSTANPQAMEAVKFYTYAIDMALQRPAWEPAGLAREEMAILYANRAQAYMSAGMWPEGAVDAETSVELKKVGNGKAWWRRGKCLVEMGRWEEAGRWVKEGVEIEGAGGEENKAAGGEKELIALGKDIERRMEEKRRS